ncbi:MAG: N-acetyltransferase, partial [Pseudomonadota bacterium]
MTPRRATEADIPAIQAFLRAHIQTSMFPLANLEAHGLGSDAPRGTTHWLFEDGPRLTGLYAQTNEGMGMPQLPGATPDHAKALAEEGAGRSLIGMLGATAQVRTLQTAWGLQDQPIRHDADEPGYALELSDLVVPSAPDGTSIRPVREADLPVVLPWRAAYHIETLGTPEEVAWSAAERDLQHYLVAGHHRVLVDGDAPLAMTGFNATLADVVQIG